MHVTYASPGAAEYFRKTGKFADGIVLVKEIYGTDHAQLTTGDAYWAKGVTIWFVMIKDPKGHHPRNPLWGDGWGWAPFKSDAPDKQVSTKDRLRGVSYTGEGKRLGLHPGLSCSRLRKITVSFPGNSKEMLRC